MIVVLLKRLSPPYRSLNCIGLTQEGSELLLVEFDHFGEEGGASNDSLSSKAFLFALEFAIVLEFSVVLL